MCSAHARTTIRNPKGGFLIERNTRMIIALFFVLSTGFSRFMQGCVSSIPVFRGLSNLRHGAYDIVLYSLNSCNHMLQIAQIQKLCFEYNAPGC